jgi:acyl-CoA ligase (AMP-forming) (exosortase A-associated)
MRLDDLISAQAAIRGEAPALTVKEETLTYAELGRAVAEFASALSAAGLRRGDRVAVYLDKRIETVVSTFGAAAAGGAFVPVNPLLRPAQVGHILRDSEARFLVTSAERLETLEEEELAAASALERIVLAGGDWGEFVAAARNAEAPPRVIDVDMAAIFYTSGSTGRPKGVVLSHRNLVAGARSVVEYLGNDESDRILSVLPLSFDAGFSQLTTGFAAGAHVVMTEYLLPRDVVRLCASHGITGLTGVPPLWVQLADQEWPPEATESLRYFASTGGRMPRATLDRLREVFPAAAPFLMYGLTEAFRSTYLDPAEVDARPDSIGKAIPNAEVMVVREDGTRCDPGEQGELVHRGALVAMGYWNDPQGTAERFRPAPGRPEGIPVPETAVWSGDRVVEDEEGFLYFVGRGDEMIKTSGYRVSPSEVEEAAFETGLVRDAVALGIEDPRIGQRIAIVVAPKGDGGSFEPDALLGDLRKQLPAYMVPREVEVLPELPRSPNGKYDRTAIRERLGER